MKGTNGRLKEDGVFGEETLSAWNQLLNNLERGVVPTLAWIDVLKTNKTGIEIGKSKAGSFNNAYVYKQMVSQSTLFAYVDTFAIVAALAFLLIPVAFFMKK